MKDNSKTISLDDLCDRIIDIFLDEPILDRKNLQPRIRSVLKIWHRATNIPKDYNNIKTDKGILQRTIEQKEIENQFWRDILKEEIDKDKLDKYFQNLDNILIDLGYKK